MCLGSLFSRLSSSLNFCETSFSSPWPDHCWRFSLLKEKNAPLVHTTKFKTRELFPPSPLGRLVIQPCFTASPGTFRKISADGFPPVSAVYHSLLFFCCCYLICGSKWTPFTNTFLYTSSLSHIIKHQKSIWSFFFFVCFLNLSSFWIVFPLPLL